MRRSWRTPARLEEVWLVTLPAATFCQSTRRTGDATEDLTFHCPYCTRAIVKKGEWFRTGPKFKCQECQHEVRLTYADKVALFEEHAHLVTV